MSDAGLYENPLVPNKKLLQMYSVMADARVLDEHIAGMQKGVKARRRLESTKGQEACRVSTALELLPGDLVSDSQAGVVMDLIAGAQSKAQIDSLLGRVVEFHAGKIDGARLAREGALARVLPWVEDASSRLRMAMGAALSFKTLKRGSVVVAYVGRSELDKKEWQEIIESVAKLDLPMILVVLPSRGDKKDGVNQLSAKVRGWGMPGIPVDANDAVALYRVTQESLGRIRGGGGPVLIECKGYRVDGVGGDSRQDPLVQMKSFLLGRKVCTKAWLERAGERLRKRISSTEQ
ncbi:thiamine pyrophosphate-dependent enzyme [Tunturiibacter gelidoferens]|uniref:TPP-dependent pyruvate/acetoin dehydrogenase alpha subunit n=2 Tax=Tunturiibacter TaxID=3154218 RepID=A0A7Y9T3I0_9BACT|nr:thiamine pyrophosphate-dependent enzyme [Edaphobacter lichenicola]MBB5338347.1 TPP-dependent pyruvate/acetoin dehydrogenase alpha subunit [Edaphobacter lichenicola]NYF52406.1 TPP-dependent pyruvate/acetoin dehydrogenase alpha subunit [Edaphobacter lichenicola]